MPPPSKNTKRDHSEWITSLLGSGIALIAGLAASVLAGSQLFNKAARQTSSDVQFVERIDAVRKDLAEQAATTKTLTAKVEALAKIPPGSEPAIQVAAVRGDLTALEKRIQGIETAILDNPTKAISIPLLRQELDTAKLTAQKEADSQTKQIDRIYDQNKWFIGLMFTMAVGLIGLAVSNFLQARKASDE